MAGRRPTTGGAANGAPSGPAGVGVAARPDASAGGLIVVGLGPGPAAHLTAEAREVLAQAREVWLRTARHPAVAALPSHLTLHGFDDLLARRPSERACRRVARQLVEQARSGGTAGPAVVYAVPGHPLIGDASVRHVLAAARDAGIAVRIVAGLSFVEPVCTALGLDPLADGLQILDAAALAAAYRSPPRRRPNRDDARRWAWLLQRARPPFDPTRPLLLAHVAGATLARRLWSLLLERYPATHRVALVCAPGDLDGAPVIEMPLAELARAPLGVGVATLYVPSLAPLDAVSELTGQRAVVARLRAPGGCPWD
ncbi:MAG: hypothetical protein HY691_03345, partial [Chloroflexi bacterium]|nr:hypothetical protein [Chloroflexota bacterium]